jgi:hypothetical protein
VLYVSNIIALNDWLSGDSQLKLKESLPNYSLMDDRKLTGQYKTWIGLFEAVLEAQKSDVEKASIEIWNGFLVFVFVLIPSIQSW